MSPLANKSIALIACAALLVSSARAQPMIESEREGDSLSPIVLQLDRISIERGATPSAGGGSTKKAEQVFWLLATAIVTFGIPLLDLPRVLEEGSADSSSAGPCPDSWNKVLVEAQPWLSSTDAQKFVLQTVRDEAARLIAIRARPVAVEMAMGGAGQTERTAALREISTRLSAPSLLLADLSVAVVPPSSGCSARIWARANVRIESTEAAQGGMAVATASFSTQVSKTESVGLQEWGADGGGGRRALRLALLQLGAGIVDAYPWPQGAEASSPASAPTPTGDTSGIGAKP